MAMSAALARALVLACLTAFCAAAASGPYLDDPSRLQEIERSGLTFSEVVAGPAGAGLDNEALYRTPAYRSIVDSLAADLAALATTDPQLGASIKKPHRLFDAGWLRPPAARFELVNRMDRDAV